jgi:RNA recognition motif-containing protein
MTEARDAQNAISQLNGTELHGRALHVNEARPKPTGGGGRGGFDRPKMSPPYQW